MSDLKSYPVMKDSGVPSLGEVPAHWVKLPLKRIAGIDSSGSYGVAALANTSFTLVRNELDLVWQASA